MKEKSKKITKECTTSATKANKTKLSDAEKKAFERTREKLEKRVTPPKFKKTGPKDVTHVEMDPLKYFPQILETTGSLDSDFIQNIMVQVSSTLPDEDGEKVMNFSAALMHGLKPQDETEGILVAQMAGTHNLIMKCMREAVNPGQFPAIANDYTLRACKLMHVFLKQLEMLEKYRGKTAHQKVIVEHVHIHQGGQAVVGHIDNRPRGEGDEKKD